MLNNSIIIDLLPQRIAVLDAEGNIISVNKAWYDFAKANSLPNKLEYLVEGVNYLEVCKNANNQDALVFAKAIEAVISQEIEVFEMEYECSSPSGEEAWFVATIKPVITKTAFSLVVMHTEITKQKLAEKKANKEKNHLFQILELASDAIVVLNQKQEICVFNRTAREIFGYREEEIFGRELSFLVGHKFNRTSRLNIDEFIGCNGLSSSIDKEEFLGVDKNGKEFPIELVVSKLFSEGEIFFTVIIRDVSKLKTANKLLHLQAMLLTSISDAMTIFLQSHDIKQAVLPILRAVSNETKSSFVGLGLFNSDLTVDVITNTSDTIKGEISKSLYEKIENDLVIFENISLADQVAYLAKRALFSNLNQKKTSIKKTKSLFLEEIFKLRNFLSIPIKCQGEIKSVLILSNVFFPYENETITLLEPASEALGVIYDSYQHIQQKEKLEHKQKLNQLELLTRARHQSVLVRLGRYALLEQDISKLTEYFTNTVKDTLGVDCCFLLEFDSDNVLFLKKESVGLVETHIPFNSNTASFAYINSNSLINTLLYSTGPLIIDDLDTDLRFNTPTFFKSQLFKSGISIVLYINNEVFGFLGAFTRTKRLFSSNEANFLQSIAHTLVAAIKRKRDEDALGEQLKLVDASHEAIIACDLKQKVIFWSKGASNLYAVDKEKALGCLVSDLITNKDPNLINGIIDRVVKSDKWVGEITSQDANGNDMVVLSHWTLVYNKVKKTKTFLLVNTNVTEKKKLETQFLRTQRMENLGSLSSGIAHDLNNLLTPIILSLDLLKKHANERSLRLIERIESSTKRGSEMVKQIISFAKGIESTQTAINIHHILDELLNIIKISFPSNIKVSLANSPDLWLISANATQIFQVLMNLCVNAKEAMFEGGLLTITTKNVFIDDLEAFKEINAPAPFLQISISDSGTGISPELIKKIFEPFFTTKGNKGTGLGLAMVAGIVEKHKGFIRVESQIGKGTTFSIYLPAIKEEIKEFLNKNEENLLLGNNQSVLLLSSEASTLKISKTILEAYGYRVFLASNVSEVTRGCFDTHQFIDVIIVDMLTTELKIINIFSLLKTINPNLKVIIASKELDSLSSIDSTFVPVKKVTKPYTAETLLKALKEILSEQKG